MIIHVAESFYDDFFCAPTLHLSASYKCWTFTLPQPLRLPSAMPGNQTLPPRPLGFITESLFCKLNRATSSHRGRKPPITRGFRPSQCAYRGPVEIISWAQPACWQDQYIMFIWMARNFVFHRYHRKQTSHPPLLKFILLTEKENTLTQSAPDYFLQKMLGKKGHSCISRENHRLLNLLLQTMCTR